MGGYKLSVHNTVTNNRTPPPTRPCCSLSSWALICLMTLEQLIHMPALGPLHWLFPLPGIYYFQISLPITLTSSSLCSNISFSTKPTPKLFPIATYPYQHPWVSLSCHLFCCFIKPSKTLYKELVIYWKLRHMGQGSESLASLLS